jgi:hypothetical protein
MMQRQADYYITIVCLLSCAAVNAQSFRDKASIQPVEKTGFYSLTMTPELSSFVKADFRDLRIVDENGSPVPYIIRRSLPLYKPAEFTPLPILSNQLSDSGESEIIVEKNGEEKISGFYLKIKNASVSRTIDLNGSDDGKHWYSITENLNLQKRFITDDDSYMEDVEFPLSSYRYFRLIIYNGKNDPLNILSVVRYHGQELASAPSVVNNPACNISRKDSNDHISYITVHNPRLFHISHILLPVKAPKFFKRDVDVVAPDQPDYHFTVSSTPASLHQDILKDSEPVFEFDLPVWKDSVFQIRIFNGDNPPLLMQSVSTAQEIKKVVAYLEAGRQYTMEMNSDSAELPRYELQDFKDSISIDVPEFKILKVEPLIYTTVSSAGVFKQWWLWAVIIFILIVLVLFTSRLAKEVGKH